MRQTKGRIWYVAHYAGGPGIGRHSRGWYLSQNWSNLGFKPTIIAANNHHLLDAPQPQGAQSVDGIDYEFLDTPRYSGNGLGRVWNMLAFTLQLELKARQLVNQYGRPDMVIASSPHPFAFIATHRLARKLGAKSVFEVRDLWPESLIELMNVSPRHPFVQLMARIERYAYRSSDAVVSLLPGTREYMSARGLEDKRWHFIPNGIDQGEVIEPPQNQSEVMERITSWRAMGNCVIAYAGALGGPNNLDVLLAALSVVKQNGAKVKAIIIGKGDREVELRQKAMEADLSNHLYFFHQIPRRKLLSILSEVDMGFVSLLPSGIFKYGISPNKIYDYMLTKTPIISAVNSGNDIVTDAKCGISIKSNNAEDVAQAMIKVSKMEAADRKAMGLRGFHYALENFSYSRLAEEYLSIMHGHNLEADSSYSQRDIPK